MYKVDSEEIKTTSSIQTIKRPQQTEQRFTTIAIVRVLAVAKDLRGHLEDCRDVLGTSCEVSPCFAAGITSERPQERMSEGVVSIDGNNE